MYQPILVHTNIHKSPKIRDVTDHSLQHHTSVEMFQGGHIITEVRHDELGSWVTSGFQQLLTNVL